MNLPNQDPTPETLPAERIDVEQYRTLDEFARHNRQ